MPTIKQMREQMDAAVDAMRREFSSVRTGKASPALLDTVRVDAYGSKMPLNQVATVNTPEPRLIVVQPWDKSLLVETLDNAEVAMQEAVTMFMRTQGLANWGKAVQPRTGSHGAPPTGVATGPSICRSAQRSRSTAAPSEILRRAHRARRSRLSSR